MIDFQADVLDFFLALGCLYRLMAAIARFRFADRETQPGFPGRVFVCHVVTVKQ